MNNLKQKYQDEIMLKLQEEFGLKNKMAIPRLEKVVISIGLAEAKEDEKIAEKVAVYLTALSGQKPVITKAKKSIAGFKVNVGQTVGIMVTLRAEKMYDFLEKLFNIVLPKVRDFRGIPRTAFDSQGNFTLGLREQTIFPEVDYRTVDKTRGMAVTIVTTARQRAQAEKLLEYLGMPFRKEENSKH